MRAVYGLDIKESRTIFLISLVRVNMLYLVDISGMIYRCFYSLPQHRHHHFLSTLRAYISSLCARIKKQSPKHRIIFALDSIPEYRRKIFSAYKAHRPPTPQPIAESFLALPDMLKDMSLHAIKEEGHEADDVIATLALLAEKKGISTIIISPDKDLLQVISSCVSVCQCFSLDKPPMTKEKVFEKYGVYPEQIGDMLALTGDQADNIPGVIGIGIKRAARLLNSMSSLNNILKYPERIPSKYHRYRIPEYKDMLTLNYKLVCLQCSLPINL